MTLCSGGPDGGGNALRTLVYGTGDKEIALAVRLQHSPHYRIAGFLTYGRQLKRYTIAERPVCYFEEPGEHRLSGGQAGHRRRVVLVAGRGPRRTRTAGEVLYRGGCPRACGSADRRGDRRPADEAGRARDPHRGPAGSSRDPHLARRNPRRGARPDDPRHGRCRLDRFGAVPPAGRLRRGAARALRQCRDADAQHPPRARGTPSRSDLHPGDRRCPHARAAQPRICDLPSADRLPRCGLQARAAHGGESLRGGAGQRRRNAQCRRPLPALRRGEDGDDLDRQGREPDQCDGASKRMAEIYVQSLGQAIRRGRVGGCTQFVTTRFGNVLGRTARSSPVSANRSSGAAR